MILFFLPVFACYAYFCCYTVLRNLYLSGSITSVGSSFGFLNIQRERTGNSVDMRVYTTTENTGQTLWNSQVSAWSLVGNECFSSSNNTLWETEMHKHPLTGGGADKVQGSLNPGQAAAPPRPNTATHTRKVLSHPNTHTLTPRRTHNLVAYKQL